MLADLRFALRGMLKRPGFVASVCGTLALGVAVVTTMFTFVNSILLAPLPFPNSGELVQLCDYQRKENKSFTQVSIPDVMDWKQQSSVFADLGYFGLGTMALTGAGEAEPIQVIRVSDGFLSAFRVQPFIGRWFATEDHAPGPDRVCMITHQLWKRRFGSDREIVGKNLALNGTSVTIVGVMPSGFAFPDSSQVALTSGFINWEKKNRELRWFGAVGRLKPGVPLKAAQAELSAIAKELEQKYPNTNGNRDVRVVPLKEQMLGDTGRALRILFGAVCCVLIIACSNVASLLIVRAVERKKEFAIRIALGANRFQIAKQQLTESVLLGVIGGVLAVVASFWCVKALIGLSPARIPRLDEVQMDAGVLLFCLVISVLCGLVFGLAPVLQTFRTNVTESLNEEGKAGSGSHRTSWTRSGILLVQVVITVVLMVVAGLFIRSYSLMQGVDVCFNPEKVVVSKISLRTGQYPADANRTKLFKPLLARLELLPEKTKVALAARPPFTPPFIVTMGVDGVAQSPTERPTARFNSVSGQYFETLGMRIVAGRNFDNTDNETSSRVVIVNQCLAKKHLGDGNPVGQRITVQGNGTNLFTVVGVVNDIRQASFTQEPDPELYFHCLQINETTVHVVARVEHAADVKTFAAGIRKELSTLDDRQAAGSIEPLEVILDRSLQVQKFRTYLLTCFAGIALMLSAVGIFGFLSYTVGQRTREIGILAALGAPRKYVLTTMMKETMLVIILGLTLGLIAAYAVSRLIESSLFEVKSADIATFVMVAVFVGFVAALAAYLPTRRATKMEVMTALRS